MDELLVLPELLLTNGRHRTLGGRQYEVFDAVILQEQVLEGSDGPLFYPLPEINQDVGAWNGYPVTARHPTKLVDGVLRPVSARAPETAELFQVGTVYNDRMVGEKRLVEVWFDVRVADRIDPRILRTVRAGKPLNVSTGLFTGKVPEAGTHNGRPYTHRVKGIRPDHLAVLVDEKGACSTDDGCGINVNAEPNYPEKCPHCGTALEIDPDSGICNRCGKKVAPVSNSGDSDVNKEQLVQFLVGNCTCWKGKDAVLNALDEEALKALKTNHELAQAGKEAVGKLAMTVNALKGTGLKLDDPSKVVEVITNMTPDECKAWAAKNMKGMMSTNTDAERDKKVEITGEMIGNAIKAMKPDELMALLPAPITNSVRLADEVLLNQKVAVIKKLVANVRDDAKRKEKVEYYKKLDLPTLNQFLDVLNDAAPAKTESTEDERFWALYNGQADGRPSNNSGGGRGGEVLRPSPSLNHRSYGGDAVEVIEE